jgi:hypothetical protein
MGTHRQQWMPFWPPLLMAGKGFIKNASSIELNLFTLNLLICIKVCNSSLVNPFGRGYLHWIRRIYQSHAIGGENCSAMVVMFVDCCVDGEWYFLYYSYHRNPKGWEFFVPTRTL